jgi:hypothetical protein
VANSTVIANFDAGELCVRFESWAQGWMVRGCLIWPSKFAEFSPVALPTTEIDAAAGQYARTIMELFGAGASASSGVSCPPRRGVLPDCSFEHPYCSGEALPS